jgi:hypothetical protein
LYGPLLETMVGDFHPVGRLADRGFSGLRLHVGSLIIVVGRMFADDNPAPHPVRF